MGTIILGLLVALPFLAVAGLLFGILIYKAAENKMHASFTREGEAEFLVSGGNLIKIFINLDGWDLTTDGWIRPLPGQPKQYGIEPAWDRADPEPDEKFYLVPQGFVTRFLRNRLGLYWVSLFYPWKSIYKFPITKQKLLSNTETKEDTGLKGRVTHEIVQVDSLRVVFPASFYFRDIETKDGFKVDLVLTGLFRVVIPYISVMLLGGKYLQIIEAAINTALIDFLRSRTYQQMIREPKGKDSEFWTEMAKINFNPNGKGLVETTGIMLIDIFPEDMDLAEGQEEEENATRAMEIATLRGNAEVALAKLQKEAMIQIAIGMAAEDVQLVRALEGDTGVAELVTAQKISKNLKGLQVLGGNSLIGVSLNPKDKKPV